METIRYYILFPSHTEGVKLEAALKKEKIKNTIVPTPRELSASCGISIMYNREDEERIKLLVDSNNVKTLGFHCVKKKIVNPYL
ncbi:DUF3343 domain-containing protein [Clostridium thailandense]|uniref:DUF3343 domain-containing protein n=1 Tax=Clostridium thailandense TaxID=2794346 RepID=A0A949WQ59_9CLOT|nr:DUF3343 domain-containing protein [Clostridium thailandense]MBV7272285.1 DUF3343 domain-containing protein [Clostridium thailandense]MCH5136753.1 DUF3343 domain-containing protein [Clostridiaceae bacterium UIB06]